MKTILFMAVSADGYVARKDGNEDFLPYEGWLQMLKFAKKGLLNEIVLNYNTTILTDGIKLFGESGFELELELKKVKKIQKNIVQVHYYIKN